LSLDGQGQYPQISTNEHKQLNNLLGVMRAFRAILVFLALSFAISGRCTKPVDEEFLRAFMAGDYELIGRKPDSTTTYSGRLTLRAEGDVLQATRTTDGTTTQATVRFDTAGADRIPVLRMRFSADGIEYEATYLWQSDLDNYPRFTGVVYRADHQTKSRGIEALFPIHQ
jgi:hypothetical protein